MAKNELTDLIKLHYDIHKYSSYSASYFPENIQEDCPNNQTSRWSSDTNNPPQYLTLKLKRPAIVSQIKFGKYAKAHVCNLKKFKIFGGFDEDHLILLFEGGLKNSSTPEVFNLKHKTESGNFLPIFFIQIMPLLSWGTSFNFSIWYVELLGQDDPIFVCPSLRNYNMVRELEIVRLCLKHFRQQGYESAFEALQKQTKVNLEHPVMSELHNYLVIQGNFLKTEQYVEQFVNEGLMDNHLTKQDYKATWTQQESEGSENRPGMRGGHQLVMDSTNSFMYLFGGWNGSEDLDDLWSYDIKRNSWSLIYANVEDYGGPAARSCHKMLFNPCTSQIFTLGRYLDAPNRTKEMIQSDFYLYDTVNKSWLLICDDTSQVGGPPLLFDHQMCIDTAKHTIYVFGGRVVTARNIDELTNDVQYSGLYSYHIGNNTWTQILVDCDHPTASNPDVLSIKSRVTHSMLFHNRYRKLYIFGGQRNKEYETDFISYNVDTHELSAVVNSDSSKNMPQSGFTQRATIDCERDEIYVLSSLSKEKERRDINLNSFYMYSLKSGEWTCVYKCDHSIEQCWNTSHNVCPEPCPRYAHQLVYDEINKVHYLFGGNPGKYSLPNLRLNDFWVLHLQKPSREAVLRHCKFLIRKLEYKEIAKKDPVRAMSYLQTKLSEIIDHSDKEQLKEFHKLASVLFQSGVDNQTTIQTATMTTPLGKKSVATETDDIKDNDGGQSYAKCTSPSCCFSGSSNSSKMSSQFLSPQEMAKQFAIKFESPSYENQSQRCFLYNKIVELLPDHMVQPKSNISDFV